MSGIVSPFQLPALQAVVSVSHQNTLYMYLLFAATAISLYISVVAWRRRTIGPVASAVVLFMGASSWWGLTYGINWSGLVWPFPYFWRDASYLGAVAVPTAYFVFSLYYTDRGHRLTRRVKALLAVEPVLTLALLFTDSRHGFFFAGKRISDGAAILSGGSWFWVNIAYSYLLILTAFVILIRHSLKARGLYRKQTLIILLGSLVPWVSSAAGLFGFTPLPELDLTPFAFTITGAVFAYALFRLKLLNILPVARGALVEVMTDGVFVVDLNNRVVDINLAAQKFLGIDKTSIGKDATRLFKNTPDIVSRFINVREGQFEIFTEYFGRRHLDMRIVPLYSKRKEYNGRLIIFRDITEQKAAEMELNRANRVLREQLSEIEKLQLELRRQAVRDPLTGLYNRRYLEETLQSEEVLAVRDEMPLSILMLDIDHFKVFNDTYGHRAGDTVLRKFSRLLMLNSREGGDISCRYGGDEFVVVLTRTSKTVASSRAEEIRKKVEELQVTVDGNDLSITVSIGVAALPDDGPTGEQVLNAADDALYKAKEAGRNLVVVQGEN